MNLTEPQCGTDLGLLAHQGGAAIRRQLQDHRHQDLHLRRRARHDGQHHPSRAGADRRRARRHQGRVAVRGAEGDGQCRRLAGRAQRRHLRLDRAQDGHSRQFHLRDELRQRHRLADRRREQGHAGHVRDDERGPARRLRAGSRAIRGRLSERGRLCARSPAGPLADGAEGAGQAGRSHHRASGRAPHAAHHPRLQRGGARHGGVDRAEERRRASLGRSEGSQGGRRSHGPDDAGAEGLPHRQWLCQCGAGAADVWRPRLHRRAGHGAVRARCAHRHDL